MTVAVPIPPGIGLTDLPVDAPREEVISYIRSRLQQDELWRFVTKDEPEYLRNELEHGILNITPLERERIARCGLAEDLLYRLHQLGLSTIETEAGRFTSWRLIAAVGGNRDVVQEAFTAAVKNLNTRAKRKYDAMAKLKVWCDWEIGAKIRYQQKFRSRDGLYQLMTERPDLIKARYMRDIISEHFFPTAETHRVPKAREEWKLMLASIHVLEVIQDTELENYKLHPNRKPVFLELLHPTDPTWDKVLNDLRDKAVGLVRKDQIDETRIMFDRWKQELTDAYNEDLFAKENDPCHGSKMAEGTRYTNSDKDKHPGLKAEFAAEQLMDRVIRRARDGEIHELERVLSLAQEHAPIDRHGFVEMVNRMLDALNLRIQTEDGVQHRLAIKSSASKYGTIQLSGNESGKTRGFKRTGPLRIVRTNTTYIGASSRPPKLDQ